MQNKTGFAPVIAVLLAIAALSGMDALIKGAASSFGTLQIVFTRYVLGFAMALPFALPALRGGLPMQSIRANALRGAVIAVTATSFFFALGRLPLAFAVTLAFTAPLWMVLLSRFMLGEPIPRQSFAALGVGFVGVLVLVFGGGKAAGAEGGLDVPGMAAALLASLGYALATVLLRKQTAYDTIPVLVAGQALVALTLIAPFAIPTLEPLEKLDVAHFLTIGVLGTLGHFALTWGFKNAPASRLAPLEYTTFLWAALYGFVFFAETPGPELIFGGGLIIAASAMVATARVRTASAPA
ncbi:MAG: DMT family transporter [Rhodobiaceae bacterium]|nr:DMT family transporter [Rhodobiaceae bacterium]